MRPWVLTAIGNDYGQDEFFAPRVATLAEWATSGPLIVAVHPSSRNGLHEFYLMWTMSKRSQRR